VVPFAALLAVSGTTFGVRAESPGLSGNPDWQGITHGAPVVDCAWPAAGTVIKGISGGYERCGAVYIGGRVIVTAAHCLDGPIWFNVPCEDDGDCPDLAAELNGEVDVTCEESPIDPSKMACVDTSADADNQAIDPDYVRFGGVYPETYSDGELRKSVQIEYCRAVDIEASGGANDFAYCLLSEEPNIQPVPIAVPCEVDAEMLEGTTVIAVGPGRCIVNSESSGGTKRWASAELEMDLTSTSLTISVGHLPENWTTDPVSDCGAVDDTAGSPAVYPTHGDSGSGLYATLSDGTWRLLGIAATDAPSYTPVWSHIDFMLDDANISEDDIIPCHDASLDWEGGTACVPSPSAPDEASGRWERGAHACHGDTASRTNVCPSLLERPSSPPPADLSLVPPASGPSTAAADRTDTGCGLVGAITPPAMLGLVVLPLLGGRRRRRQ
jgi:hypothetical protein